MALAILDALKGIKSVSTPGTEIPTTAEYPVPRWFATLYGAKLIANACGYLLLASILFMTWLRQSPEVKFQRLWWALGVGQLWAGITLIVEFVGALAAGLHQNLVIGRAIIGWLVWQPCKAG